MLHRLASRAGSQPVETDKGTHSHMNRTLYSTRYKRMTDELRRAREHRGWSQGYAAHVVGSSRSWIGKIERAELRLDIVQLIHICQCYGIGFNRLLRRLEEEPSDEDGSFYLSGVHRPRLCLLNFSGLAANPPLRIPASPPCAGWPTRQSAGIPAADPTSARHPIIRAEASYVAVPVYTPTSRP